MRSEVELPDPAPVVREMREKYPASRDQLIPLLQYVQSRLGYLPSEAMKSIAEHLKVPASHVYGVATFYTQFRFKPLGKNRITVCRGTACHVRGGKKVIEEINKELGIEDGGTTDDLSFSLETVACVGSCALAPVVVVNDRVYGKVTAKRMREIIHKIQGVAPEGEEEEQAEEKPAPRAQKEEKAPRKPPKEKPAEKQASEKPEEKKAAKKTAAKKAGKKTAKRAAKKRPAKKAGKKKSAKRTVKKSAKKKTAKKTGKKKTAKKPAGKSGGKKSAKKKTGAKKPGKKKAGQKGKRSAGKKRG